MLLTRLLLLAVVLSSACVTVQPWERETLAAPALQEPPAPLVFRENLHVISVREASRGGYGMTGGGCGCN